MVYSIPAQPPFLTPTRMPAIGLSARAITSLMRDAAASVSRITWGLDRTIDMSILASKPDVGTGHHMFNTRRASSDIRLGSHGGSQTTSTLVSFTPGTLDTAFSTRIGNSCADGQLGDVSDMSILTERSSPMSIR